MNKHSMPLISIIIPIYNVEPYLPRCIDSIISQTYSNLEIILINDGSTDGCREICDHYLLKDSRITVIHQKNAGVSAARNKGLECAKGELIGFVDADDIISPNMYLQLQQFLKKCGADISICQMGFSDKEQTPNLNSKHYVIDGISATKMLLCQKIGTSCCNKLYRRSIIADNRFPSIKNGEDFVFNYSVFLNAKTIISFNAKLYHYTKREKSASNGGLSVDAFSLFDAINALESSEHSKDLSPYLCIRKAIYARNYLCDIIKYNHNQQYYHLMRKYALAAKFTLFSKKWPVDKKFKIHILLLWICPFLYTYLVKKRAQRN